MDWTGFVISFAVASYSFVGILAFLFGYRGWGFMFSMGAMLVTGVTIMAFFITQIIAS
jgi:hypothetical protein